MKSHLLKRAKNPADAWGQIGGHVKSGCPHPLGARTKKPMALVSALPLRPGSDKVVLAFLDRSDPVETFDSRFGSGDNAVLVVPRSTFGISIVKGVCPGDWRGMRVDVAEEIEEPVDLDIDPTGLDIAASDAWVDLVDDLGVDGTKVGGYPLWANAPIDVDSVMGSPHHFHHRLTEDHIEFGLGEGCVIYVFVAEDESGGAIMWQRSGGGEEQTYSHY